MTDPVGCKGMIRAASVYIIGDAPNGEATPTSLLDIYLIYNPLASDSSDLAKFIEI
jgi:hypothetical protein